MRGGVYAVKMVGGRERGGGQRKAKEVKEGIVGSLTYIGT